MRRRSSATSVIAKLGFWRMHPAYEQLQRLALRAPVELARRHLLDHDRRAAHPARQAGAVVHPVPVVAARHRRAVRLGVEVVHRHHLAGLDADREQPHPVAPQVAHDLFAAPPDPGCAGSAARGTAARRGRRCRCRSRRVWSISSRPIGVGLRRTTAVKRSSPSATSSTSGSGPSLAIVAATSSGVCSSHAVGPRRSAHVTSVSRRSRTWPTTGGGHSSPSSASPVVCSDMRTCTRARRGAPIEVSEFSPAASRIGLVRGEACRAGSSGPSARSPTRSSGRRRSRPRSPTRRTCPGARAARGRRRTRGTSACRPRAPPSRSRPSMMRAPSANRPCGLDAATARPTKLRSNWRAMRWTECPSAWRSAGFGVERAVVGGEHVGLPRGRARVGLEGAVVLERGDLARCGARAAPRRENGVAMNRSMNVGASSNVCWRAPIAITFASLCSRASSAVAMLQTSAARMPRTLFAAICSPLPEPPKTTPSVSTPASWSRDDRLRGTDAERRVVVERLVVERAVVDDVVPLARRGDAAAGWRTRGRRGRSRCGCAWPSFY